MISAIDYLMLIFKKSVKVSLCACVRMRARLSRPAPPPVKLISIVCSHSPSYSTLYFMAAIDTLIVPSCF